MDINNLSIEEKIGQMLIVGIDGNKITDRTKKLILKYKVGGVILYKKNFHTYDEMLSLIKELKKLNSINKIPLFVSVDQEGGRVNRLPNEFLNIPSASRLAKSENNKENIYHAYDIIGKILYGCGFNMNLAPVLDIKRFRDNHPLGNRCFSDSSSDVAEYGVDSLNALKSNNIIPVIKHFPGHGSTQYDSHSALPIIKKDIKLLQSEDMYPFEFAIKNGADSLIISHLVFPKISGIYPVSLSKKFIYKYIRKKYKYNGLIITDDLSMNAISFFYGTNLAIKKAFNAGNDVMIFKFKKKEEDIVFKRIYSLVKYKKIKISRINKSVERILKIKSKYHISDLDEITRS